MESNERSVLRSEMFNNEISAMSNSMINHVAVDMFVHQSIWKKNKSKETHKKKLLILYLLSRFDYPLPADHHVTGRNFLIPRIIYSYSLLIWSRSQIKHNITSSVYDFCNDLGQLLVLPF